MQAMLQMKKLDIAALEAAYDGADAASGGGRRRGSGRMTGPRDLPAGEFSAWLRGTRAALGGEGDGRRALR